MRRTAAHAHGLSLSLRLGSAWDWVLALAILVAHPGLMRLVGFPTPADLFLYRLTALPPLFFPIVYITAAHDPVGRPWAVRASILFRGLGGFLLGLLAIVYRPPGEGVYLAVAGIDLGWALVHAVLWSRVKRHRSV